MRKLLWAMMKDDPAFAVLIGFAAGVFVSFWFMLALVLIDVGKHCP